MRQAGATLHRGARASHYRGLSCCRAQAPDTQAQWLWLTGPVAPRHVGSPQTRARTRVPCISRQILNHCATREAPFFSLIEGIIFPLFDHSHLVLTPPCNVGEYLHKAMVHGRGTCLEGLRISWIVNTLHVPMAVDGLHTNQVRTSQLRPPCILHQVENTGSHYPPPTTPPWSSFCSVISTQLPTAPSLRGAGDKK